MFSVNAKERKAGVCFSGSKSVSEKLHFRGGLVWTVRLTGVIKLHFEIPPAMDGT